MADSNDVRMILESADDIGVSLTPEQVSDLLDRNAEKQKPEGSPYDTLAFMGVIVRTPDPNLFGTRVLLPPVHRSVNPEFPNFPG